MATIVLSEEVKRRLRSSLCEEHDLLDSVRQARFQEVPGKPGRRRSACLVAVRRPLDPETAELRRVEVTVREDQCGWVIEEVGGLDEVPEG